MNDDDKLECLTNAIHYILEYLNHPKKEDWRLKKATLYLEKIIERKGDKKNGISRNRTNDGK